MSRIKKLILVGGLQNLWQVGLFFPLNIFATLYFMFKARFKIHTSLDLSVALYIFAGVISLFTGSMISIIDGSDSGLFLNSLKSFLVFLGVIVFFGAHGLRVEEFFKVAMWVVALTGIAILINYAYLLLNDSLSLYSMRSAISWSPGWPQRWVMFALIGHFVYLCRYDFSRSNIDLGISLVLLTIILLGSTRSAVIGLFAGHFVLSILSKRDFFRSLLVFAMIGLAAGIFFDDFKDSYRIQGVQEFFESGDDGSLSYRFGMLWPGIIDSLGVARIPFGWGHVGVAFIPHHFFYDASQISNISGLQIGSAESQYVDVLFRQGIVGLFIFSMILVCGLVYSYKLYRYEINAERRSIWKASLAWQVSIILHGITVETLRFSIYSLFFFLFLGILSNEYCRLRKLHRTKGTTQRIVEWNHSFINFKAKFR